MNRKQKEFQLIITGLKIKENSNKILEFVNNGIKLKNWIDYDGNIGHLGNTTLTTIEVKHELKMVSENFKDLELGVSYMSGPNGSYNSIIETFKIKNGKILKIPNPHVGHPPPRKIFSAPLDKTKQVHIVLPATNKEEKNK